MLEVTIPEMECFDSKKGEFIVIPEQKIELEHSLLSISLWESKWHKPFLGKDNKSEEEMLDYIKDMTLTKGVPDEAYLGLTTDVAEKINQYINDPMTGTYFSNQPNEVLRRDVVTNELIYYWMITLGIPFECERWHLNRLLTLIKVCNIKNSPSKKMSRQEIYNQNRSLNAARRAAMNTRG